MLKNGLRRFLAIVLCIMMVFVFASCGSSDEQQDAQDQQTEETATEEATEETQDEVAEEAWEGTFVETLAGRGVITVTASGDGYEVNVSWSNSAFEHTEWHFTGKSDGAGVLEYSDCTRTDVAFDENEEETDTVVYENGTGRLKLDGDTIQWEDDVDNVAAEAEFQRQ